MGRDALLKQKREYDEAIKEVKQKYKDPASIKYEIQGETGSSYGHLEYRPHNDTIVIVSGGTHAEFSGEMIKPLRDALNKLTDD